MVRYFYAWGPLVIVGTVPILLLPPLGLIALMFVSLVALGALGALAWAIIFALVMLGRAAISRWHTRSGAMAPAAAAPSTATSRIRQAQSVPAGATAVLTSTAGERDT